MTDTGIKIQLLELELNNLRREIVGLQIENEKLHKYAYADEYTCPQCMLMAISPPHHFAESRLQKLVREIENQDLTREKVGQIYRDRIRRLSRDRKALVDLAQEALLHVNSAKNFEVLRERLWEFTKKEA